MTAHDDKHRSLPADVQEAIRVQMVNFGEIPDRTSPEDFPAGYVLTREEIVSAFVRIIEADRTSRSHALQINGEGVRTQVAQDRKPAHSGTALPSTTPRKPSDEEYIADLEFSVRQCADLLRAVHWNVVADFGTTGDGLQKAEKVLRDVEYFVNHGIDSARSATRHIECEKCGNPTDGSKACTLHGEHCIFATTTRQKVFDAAMAWYDGNAPWLTADLFSACRDYRRENNRADGGK